MLMKWPAIQGRLKVVMVGAGGNGSEMLSALAKIDSGLRAFGHKGIDVLVLDDDVVSEANCYRQKFWFQDIGQYKGLVLVHRLNQMMGLNWKAIPEKFTPEYIVNADLIISCVDNYEARKLIYQSKDQASPHAIWMDLGNGDKFGQIVIGTLHDENPEPCSNVVELYPEILITEDIPNKNSCSAIESLTRQDLMLNQMMACQAGNMLWQLIRKGSISFNELRVDSEACEVLTVNG